MNHHVVCETKGNGPGSVGGGPPHPVSDGPYFLFFGGAGLAGSKSTKIQNKSPPPTRPKICHPKPPQSNPGPLPLYMVGCINLYFISTGPPGPSDDPMFHSVFTTKAQQKLYISTFPTICNDKAKGLAIV